MTKVRESAKAYHVLLVNYTLGKEIGVFVPDLLYKHTAVGFG